LLLNQFFGIYFILGKVWKIIHDNYKDLNVKELWFFELFSKGKIRGLCPWCCAPGARHRLAVHGPFIKYQPFNVGWTAEIRTTKGYVLDLIWASDFEMDDCIFMKPRSNPERPTQHGRLWFNVSKGVTCF
jgi:hypothetical protein